MVQLSTCFINECDSWNSLSITLLPNKQTKACIESWCRGVNSTILLFSPLKKDSDSVNLLFLFLGQCALSNLRITNFAVIFIGRVAIMTEYMLTLGEKEDSTQEWTTVSNGSSISTSTTLHVCPIQSSCTKISTNANLHVFDCKILRLISK